MRGDSTLKALIIRGGWAGHDPFETSEIAATELRADGVEVELADSLDALRDVDKLLALDLIVPIWTMGSIERDQLQPLLRAVKAGVGLAGWHGGMCDAFRQATDYQFMAGGQWVAHPGNATARYTVRMGPVANAITAGLETFAITSEQYYMHVDPAVNVLAHTLVAPGNASGDPYSSEAQAEVEAGKQPGIVMPVVWTKRFGKGRVYHLTLGHQASVFNIPEARTLLHRGMVWAAEGKAAAGN